MKGESESNLVAVGYEVGICILIVEAPLLCLRFISAPVGKKIKQTHSWNL